MRSGAASSSRLVVLFLAVALAPATALGQGVSQRGFLEAQGVGYPQAAVNDDTKFLVEALFRYEVSAKPAPWLRLGGSVDARGDTHDQTAWDGGSWSDRSVKRPALGVRRLDATISRGPVALQVGKQFIRWGKTDILSPTDRFAPRDYLAVVDNDFLGVTAARLTAGLQTDTLDVVAARFTPSRTPLLDQRWAGLSPGAGGVALIDRGATYPGRAQVGARWNHVGGGYEFSLSAFSGNNHLPLIEAAVPALAPGLPATAIARQQSASAPGLVMVPITRAYPGMWMLGGDAAIPSSAFTVKGEAAFFGTSDARADEYWLYVVQLERQSGEWLFLCGYAGEVVTTSRAPAAFAPDRGLTRAFLGRAGYTIDSNRSLALEGAVRQNGDGSWLRVEYSQASGQHVRLTARATWIRGAATDFLGRYDRNSHLSVGVRYSY